MKAVKTAIFILGTLTMDYGKLETRPLATFASVTRLERHIVISVFVILTRKRRVQRRIDILEYLAG